MKPTNFKPEAIVYYLSIIVFIVFSCNSGMEDKSINDVEEYRQLRSKKLNEPRPVIHNNDGGDAYVYPKQLRRFAPGTENQPRPPVSDTKVDYEFSIPNFLYYRTAGLVGTDVSTISYCTIASSFGQFTHNTKVGEFLTLDHDRPGQWNATPEFVKRNTDPLEVVSDFARKNGFEFFWSNRINDTHDYGHRPDDPYERWSELKEDHPEYLFGDIGESLPHGRWSAVDFSHQEIRDLCVEFYTEVCENYDVDGVELDFFRHLYLFENVARGEEATGEQVDMLTNMVTRIREMTERVGMEKGKPILITVRVPDSFEYCRKVGIALEEWMEKGLVDIVVGSGYFRLNPWQDLVENGDEYDDIRVYAGLSESRVRDKLPPYLSRNKNAVYRARAAAAWEAGVDGLYIFNEYNTRARYLSEIGRADNLNYTNNLYFVTYRDGNPNSYLKNGKKYANLPLLTPENPVSIESEPVSFLLEIGQESVKPARLTLSLYTRGKNPGAVKASLNGTSLKYEKTTNKGLSVFEIPYEAVERGENTLRLSRDPGESPLTLMDAAVLFYRNPYDPNIEKPLLGLDN